MHEPRPWLAIRALRSRLSLTEQQAQFVFRLYVADGAPVPHRDMERAIRPSWRKQPRNSTVEYISTLACNVRKRIGREALENNYCAYSLTEAGMRLVADALETEARPEPGP